MESHRASRSHLGSLRYHRLWILLLVAFLVAVGVARPTSAREGDGVAGDGEDTGDRVVHIGESRLELYGFVRFDAIFDDSRPNAFQTPLWILEEAQEGGTDNLTMHPRLSRVGMAVTAPPDSLPGGAMLSGRIEVDFQNGGRESRAIPRYRHVYLQIRGARHELLLGQTSDVISPLYPAANNDTLMWNAGNLGDRRPQVRYRLHSGDAFGLQTAVGLTGAVDSLDLDDDGVRDGEAAARPDLQLRLGWQRGEALRIGLWGHVAELETSTPVGGAVDFTSHSLGVDLQAEFSELVGLRGEAWTGQGLADFRGGIGQSVNTATGEEIESRGGWLEVGLHPGESYAAFLGFTVDDPVDDDLGPGDRRANRTIYLTQKLDLGEHLVFGLDLIDWQTRYVGGGEGDDRRVDLYVIYNF